MLKTDIQQKQQKANFLMLNQSLVNGINAVQLKELKKGMYIYRIKDSDGKELKTDKLIIY